MNTVPGSAPDRRATRHGRSSAWRYARGVAIVVTGWIVLSAQGYEAWASARTTVDVSAVPLK